MDSTALSRKFVFGVDEYPDWFASLDHDGRVTYEYNSKNKLVGVQVRNTKDVQRAVVGDILLYTGDLCIAVSKDISEKYMK